VSRVGSVHELYITGLLSRTLRSHRGSVWTQEGVYDGVPWSYGVLSGSRVCAWYCFRFLRSFCSKADLPILGDEFTVDVLRGFQGMGAAATIPSAVRTIPPISHYGCSP
jgi:hypothetical protein